MNAIKQWFEDFWYRTKMRYFRIKYSIIVWLDRLGVITFTYEIPDDIVDESHPSLDIKWDMYFAFPKDYRDKYIQYLMKRRQEVRDLENIIKQECESKSTQNNCCSFKA